MKHLRTISGIAAKLPLEIRQGWFTDAAGHAVPDVDILRLVNEPRPVVPPTLRKLEKAALAWRKRKNDATESALFDAAFKHEHSSGQAKP